jgi:N-acetylmuramoyl-L-alanine amidase
MLGLFFVLNTAGISQIYAQTSLSRKAISVEVDGNRVKGIMAYQNKSLWYLTIKDIAKIYNASFEWKPVSSLVTMVINGKKIDFSPNDKTVIFSKTPKEMRTSSKLVSNNIYIPIEVLTSASFAEISEVTSSWDSKKQALTVTHSPNITSIKYFSRPDDTRVELVMDQKLSFSVSRSADQITINVSKGKVAPARIVANNGIISDITAVNTNRAAIIKINLQQPPTSTSASQTKTVPEKIVININHSQTLTAAQLKADKNNSENISFDAINISPIEEGVDNSDLSKVPVQKVDVNAVDDESSEIIDDIASFGDIAVQATANKNKNAKIIIIDAGHGGTDPGAVGPRGTIEKDITLDIAYELKKLFDANPNYIAILTRKDDVFIPLVRRTQIANEDKGNLFISIHCNANINRKVGGFEVFFLSEKASDAEALATERLENSVIELEGKPTPQLANIQRMLWSMVQNEHMNESAELSAFVVAAAKGKLKIYNRGVKQAAFYVLRGANMPAVLVETAFISNYAEEAMLRTKSFQRAEALSIYEGVLRYYERKDRQRK